MAFHTQRETYKQKCHSNCYQCWLALGLGCHSQVKNINSLTKHKTALNSNIRNIAFNLIFIIDYYAIFTCWGISRDFVLKLSFECKLASPSLRVGMERTQHIYALLAIELILKSFWRKSYCISIFQCYTPLTLSNFSLYQFNYQVGISDPLKW